MIPPPRDPRMERGGAAPPVGGGSAAGGPLPRWALGVGAGMLALLVVLLPRAWSWPDLVAQNAELREQLRDVEHRMDEADRILQRLRLYDAQLRSLDPVGASGGPLPGDDDGEMLEAWQDLEEDVRAGADALVISDDLLPEGPLPDDALRPADTWAAAVADRVDDFVDLFEVNEADLAALMADLETLNAIHAALPGQWPAAGVLSSGFGWRRDPLRHDPRFHAGLDIANTPGTPVYAVADGVVVRSEYTSGYGNVVELDHGFGVHTLYGHFARRKVEEGERVERGTLIGTMGSTGRSTGPHCHFELRIDGSVHDPLKYLPR